MHLRTLRKNPGSATSNKLFFLCLALYVVILFFVDLHYTYIKANLPTSMAQLDECLIGDRRSHVRPLSSQ